MIISLLFDVFILLKCFLYENGHHIAMHFCKFLLLSLIALIVNLNVNLCCSLPFITATADGPKHIETTLTRVQFEELCSDLLDR